MKKIKYGDFRKRNYLAILFLLKLIIKIGVKEEAKSNVASL